MQILHVQSLNFSFRLTTAFTLKHRYGLAYLRKNPNRGCGLKTCNFPGVLKKKHVKIPEIN